MKKYIYLLETKDLKLIDRFMKNLENDPDERHRGIIVLTSFEELKKHIFYDSFDKDISKNFVYEVIIVDPLTIIKEKSTIERREAKVVFSMNADISLPSGTRVF